MRLGMKFLGVFLMFSTTAFGASDQAKLPSAEEVMSRYIEAIGGKKVVRSIKSSKSQGKYSDSMYNFKGTFERYYLAPDKVFLDAYGFLDGKIEAINRMVVNKSVGLWSSSSALNTIKRVMEAEEVSRFVQAVNVATFLYPKRVFKTVENLGAQNIMGEECYQLLLVRKHSFRREFSFFSIKTGLLLRSTFKVDAQTFTPLTSGDIELERRLSNYVMTDGILIPMTEILYVAAWNYTNELNLESIEFNVEIDPRIFDKENL